jgi:hypothetical protein
VIQGVVYIFNKPDTSVLETTARANRRWRWLNRLEAVSKPSGMNRTLARAG